MKKVLSILLVLILSVGLFAGCGEEEQTQPTETTPTETTEQTQTEESKNKMPIIKGSNSANVLLAMEKIGFPKAKGQVSDTGIMYQETNGIYSYDMDVNTSHEIACVNFIVTKDKDGKEILPVMSTLVHSEDISQEKAEKWVKNNVGKKAKKTFGNTVFSLNKSDMSYSLEIKHKDYDNFVINNL